MGTAMGRPRKALDDDDIPKRGRPRAPEKFGPPAPLPYQCKAYVARLQSILDALEIIELGSDERNFLRRILWRADRLRDLDPKRFTSRGDDRVIMLLRSIAETTNGVAALTLPVMRAVDDCLLDAWTARGLEFLDALDQVPMLEIDATLRGLGLQEHLGAAIRWRLAEILGPPVAAPQPAQKPAPKKAQMPPTGASQAGWESALAIQKANRLRRAKSRREARMAA